MTHYTQKRRAIELYLRGWHLADISANLNVSLRSVQRWTARIKDGDTSLPQSKAPEKVATDSKATPEALSSFVYYPSKSWVESAQVLAADHFNVHNKIRGILVSLLETQLENPENTRAIHTLSMAINRHLEGEKEIRSLHLLDVSRAAELLHSHGFVITRAIDKLNDTD